MYSTAKFILNDCTALLISQQRFLSFRSALSLSNLHPNSSLKITTPEKPDTSENSFNGYIPIEELKITYSRSSGPGGQNVNKVNTKVDVRFHVLSAKWLNDAIKTKLAEKHKTRISKDGYLIFRSDLTRSQHLNLSDCMEKIRTTIRNCVEDKTAVVLPETEERLRKRHEKAAKERLALKRRMGQIKQDRQGPSVYDVL